MLKYQEIIKQLTLEEKASLTSGKDFWTTVDIKRLNIPSIFLSDGPHGLRKQAAASDHLGLNASYPATCFPTAATIANSWDVALGERIGKAIGEEANCQDVNVVLGPGTNIKRSPLCGRNFEYFSEDPYLAGKLASSYIKGIQSQGVAACVKHYACNNQEMNRQTLDSVLDERTLREIYLKQFEIAVKEAKPKTIMSAYNLVNGVYANEDKHLLCEILRKEWGFDGVIVTDWGGNNDRVEALKCYNELEMPTANGDTALDIINAIKEGKISEQLLDENVDNLLKLVFETYKNGKTFDPFSIEEHHSIALEAASESIVLLKNDGVLPISQDKKVAFIGDFIFNPRYQGAGSSIVNPTKLDKPLDMIKEGFENITGIVKGYDRYGKKSNKLLKEALKVAQISDVIVCYLGLDEVTEAEGLDREYMRLSNNQIDLISSLKQLNKPIVVVLSAGSVIELPFADEVNGILHGYLGGQAGAKAMVDVLKGNVNPSGKLSETYPIKYEDTISYNLFPSLNRVALYKEGLFVGYRYYDKANINVRYPFGYGLSYTTFEYSNLEVNEDGVTFSITNTGKVEGKEIAQLYVSKKDSQIIRPSKELKGFVKVNLQPGETKEVSIKFDEHTFTHFNITTNKWEVEGGTYDILVGASSMDIKLGGNISKTSTTDELDNNSDLPNYMIGNVKNISDEEFSKLLGREIPNGELKFINKKKSRIVVDYNTTIVELQYAKGWAGRFFSGVIRGVIKVAKAFGKKSLANTLTMGVKHQPMRGLSRMTGGMIRWTQLDGLIEVFNGHFFKGLNKFFKEGRKYKKIKKEEKKKIMDDKKLKEKQEKARIKEEKALRKAKLKAMSKEEKIIFLTEERRAILEKFEASEVEHSEKIAAKRQSLIENNKSQAWLNFTQLGFFQAIRRWWSKYSFLHPVASKWIYQIVFFLVFSNGVTIWQYFVMLFLPYAFGGLAGIEFIWPTVSYTWFDGATLTWGIFNEPVKYSADGAVLIAGGLGNFIAFEIAVFTAQCINFPLQRNITFKSHGNPWIQAIWYLIGWVLISVFVNAIWGFMGPVIDHYAIDIWHWGTAQSVKPITDLIKTVVTGGISLIIFFFIFKIIFPEEKKGKTN